MRNKKGFTLIELLAVFAIMAIIGSALSVMTGQIYKSYIKMRAGQRNLDVGRELLYKFTDDIENAFWEDSSDYRFIGKLQELDFTAVQVHSAGVPQPVEIGYLYDSNAQTISRRFCDESIPDSNVKENPSGTGYESVIAKNIIAFELRYLYLASTGGGYKMMKNTAGSVWDSNISNFHNFSSGFEAKSPDGLPNAVEVSFTVSDPEGRIKDEDFQATIYLLGCR